MKTQGIAFIVLLTCIITPSYSMKNLENKSEIDNYTEITKSLFTAIDECDVQTCKELCDTYKDIVHKQYEFPYELGKIKGIIYDFPLCYFLSGQSNKANEGFDNKIKLQVADILIKNTNSLNVLYYCIYLTLENILRKKYIVTEVTLETFTKILAKKEDLVKNFTSKNKQKLQQLNLERNHINNRLFLFLQQYNEKTYNALSLACILRSHIDKDQKIFAIDKKNKLA